MKTFTIVTLVSLFVSSMALAQCASDADQALKVMVAKMEAVRTTVVASKSHMTFDSDWHGKGHLEVDRRSFSSGQVDHTITSPPGTPITRPIKIALESDKTRNSPAERASRAVNFGNYEFKYLDDGYEDGHKVYRFKTKPKLNNPGLVEGTLLIDAATCEPFMIKGKAISGHTGLTLNVTQTFRTVRGLPMLYQTNTNFRYFISKGQIDITQEYRDDDLELVSDTAQAAPAAVAGSVR